MFVLFDMTFSNLVYLTGSILFLVFLMLRNSEIKCIPFWKKLFLWLIFICKIKPLNSSWIYFGLEYKILYKLITFSFCLNLNLSFRFVLFSFFLIRNKDFPKPSKDCRSKAICLPAAAGHGRGTERVNHWPLALGEP